MAHQQILRGKWEEILQHAEELAGKEVELTILDSSTQELPSDASVPRTLADFLGEYIGAVEGKGEHSADQIHEVFTASLLKKHQEGHL